jgi:transcription termination/antitermination protein NusG
MGSRSLRSAKARTRESVSYIVSTAVSEVPVQRAASAIEGMESWFALVTKSRHEKVVAEALNGKGLETFLPLVQRRHQYAHRSRQFDIPLFPGYLFCRFHLARRYPVITTPGVVQIVGAGASPIAVNDGEIASLQIATRERIPAQPHPFLREGERVAITEGPLAGMKGIVVTEKDPLRIVLSIDLLQRSVLLEIAADRIISLSHDVGSDSHDDRQFRSLRFRGGCDRE